MGVKLRVLEGKSAGQEIKIPGPKFFIGRAEDCHLRPRSDMVSRHHCVILLEEGFVAIRDFGSKNGTLVNDELVKGQQELNNGDKLTVGNLQFEIRLSVGVGGRKKSKVESVEEVAERTVSMASSTDDTELHLEDWFGSGEDASTQADTQTVDMSDLVSSRDFRKKKAEDQPEDPNRPKVVGISEARAKMLKAPSSRGAAEDALKKMLRGGK
jgi:pSer/pThr/pTyr-binding forkhead associated (FHA) protein